MARPDLTPLLVLPAALLLGLAGCQTAPSTAAPGGAEDFEPSDHGPAPIAEAFERAPGPWPSGVVEHPNAEPTADPATDESEPVTIDEAPAEPEPMERLLLETSLEGLEVEELVIGEGDPVGPDSIVVLTLVGALDDDTVVQELIEPSDPWPVQSLVPGLAAGLQGMMPGGERRIVIPAEHGYGAEDVTDPATGEVIIPGNSLLIFTVTLVDVIADEDSTSATDAPDETNESSEDQR